MPAEEWASAKPGLGPPDRAVCRRCSERASAWPRGTLTGTAAIGKIITEKKVSIGVVDHHTLQVERPEEVANQIRAALKHIPAERLIISSDCGMGREGMGRRHAAYKMVAMVLGTNIVRKEIGAPEAKILAADERYSLVTPAK